MSDDEEDEVSAYRVSHITSPSMYSISIVRLKFQSRNDTRNILYVHKKSAIFLWEYGCKGLMVKFRGKTTKNPFYIEIFPFTTNTDRVLEWHKFKNVKNEANGWVDCMFFAQVCPLKNPKGLVYPWRSTDQEWTN